MNDLLKNIRLILLTAGFAFTAEELSRITGISRLTM